MSLVEEYYELNEAEEVSAIWKTMQIIFYVFAGCLGLWCGYTIALIRLKLGDKCYLFTSVKLRTVEGNKVNSGNVNWGSDSWCDYCQYSMVSSFIMATIWATFYLMCGKGGKSLTGLPQPWRIVWPSLVFNFIYFIVTISTAIKIQHGTNQFCSGQEFSETARATASYCEPLKNLQNQNFQVTSLQLEIVSKTSWSCAISWLVLFLISFFRIIFVIDFHMYKVCVFKIGDTIQNKKEEVLRITNYEEPKKLQFREERSRRVTYLNVEEKPEYFEEDKKKILKTEKKALRQNFNPTTQPPIQPNAAFYVTADIRMLSREVKSKKMSKSLDLTFEKKANSFTREIRKLNTTFRMQSKTDESHPSENFPFLCNLYPSNKDFYKEENELCNDLLNKQKKLIQKTNNSEPHNKSFFSNLPPERTISIKKFV